MWYIRGVEGVGPIQVSPKSQSYFFMNDYPIWNQEYFAPEVKLGVLDKLVIKLQNWRNRNKTKPLTYVDVYKAIAKMPR